MRPVKEDVFTCPPRAPKIKSLAAIYAAEDARKAASNRLSEFREESGSTHLNIKSELLDFEELSTLPASEGNDLNTDVRGTFEVSLKDLRARCKATKRRKSSAEPLEADDLDEPIIVLKAKRSKFSSTVQNKSMLTEVICESLVVQGSKGRQTEEDTQGIQDTLSVQTDHYTASSSSDATSSGSGAVRSIYNVITEMQGDVDMSDSYLDGVPSEPLLELTPVDISSCKVDFIPKRDSFCKPSSNLIWPTNGITQYFQNVTAPLNKSCENIAESEENLYVPENIEDHLTESKIIDAESGTDPVYQTGKAPESSSINCSFNSAYTDAQSEESFYLLKNSEGSLHEDKFSTEVESNVSSATIIGTLPTGKNLVCSIKEASMNYGKFGEILCSPENIHNNSLQSEIVVVQNGPIAVDITENIRGGKDQISSISKMCTGDMDSVRDLNSREGSPNTLHENEVTEAGTHVSTVTETLPDKENISSTCKRACNNNSEYMEKIYSLESCQNNSEENGSARGKASTSPAMVTDVATMDELANTNSENESNDNYGFLFEGGSGFGSTNLRSREGQLESIVYSAISTSKCLYKKEVDTSTSVYSPPGSPTENFETDSNCRNGFGTNFCEVFEGANQVKSTKETDKEITRVMQLYEDLEKTDNEGAKLEKHLNSDPKTIREHGPIKLLSNRTIISPTSQEKLCQALTDIELCEGSQIPKCKKSILFENCSRMKKCTISPQSTEKVIQKPKGAIKKRYLRSTGAACIKDSSPKMDTEKTIEFSRRQMQDFENVTTKLLKNMRVMRGLLEESVAVQSPWLSKAAAEEIKAASENASELERTTKRWLALMSKDCSRFCKILKSASDSASSPSTSNNGVRNRRKIVFADEAGGTLCHVKLFSEASSSSPIAETENADQ